MLFNARGSSILFVLIMISIMSVMLYVYMDLFSHSLANQRKTAARIAYVNYMTSLRALLNDAQSCETLLRGQRITNTSGINRNSQNRELVIGLGAGHLLPGGEEIKAGNTKISNLFEITEAVISVYQNDIVRSDATPDHPLRVLQYDRHHNASHGPTGTTFPYSNDYWTYKTRIQFNAKLRNTLSAFYLNTMNDTNPEMWIELIVNVDANQRIFTCHGLESIAEACEVRGGAYDASAYMNSWPELRCHPANDLCWPGPQMYTTPAVALPNSPQKPNCPWPYTDITWAGRVSGQDKWICTWCNNKRWNPPVD